MKLNKKATKLGSTPITYKVIEEKEVTRRHTYIYGMGNEKSKEYKILAKIVEVTGTAPRLNGFTFVARVEYLADHKSLFHTVPGVNIKIDERFRELNASVCEHCNLIRRRSDTFIVRNDKTGEQKQVGRQCLADYTGINTPEKAAAAASLLNLYTDISDSEGGFWNSYFESTVDTRKALAITSVYISKYGWVPKSQAEFNNPTAFYVQDHFTPGFKGNDRAKEIREVSAESETEVHQDRANKVVAWIEQELAEKANKSDYEENLVTLVCNDVCNARHLGIVCSAVSVWQRSQNQKVEYAARQETLKNSKHIGTVKERLRSLKVTVRQVKMFEGNFGPTTLVKFVTSDGNVLTWFASGDKQYEAGQEFTVDATVKGYSEYNGVKETQVNRVSEV